MLIFHSIFEWLYWRETSGPWLNPSLIFPWILIQWEREAMCDALLEPSQKGVGVLRMLKVGVQPCSLGMIPKLSATPKHSKWTWLLFFFIGSQ